MKAEQIKPDRLQLFLGLPFLVKEAVPLHSPSIEEVGSLGYMQYSIYLMLCSFRKQDILQRLYGISLEELHTIADMDDYEVLTDHPAVIRDIAEALSFFTRQQVSFHSETASFRVHEHVLVDAENYQAIAKVIACLNGIKDTTEQAKSFPSERARRMYEQMMAFEEAIHSKDESGLELKDVLSILCCAGDNGLNIFNIGRLTVYQVFEQFERMSIKDRFKRLLPVWANGYLDEKTEFEWIKETEL
ncbi:hypothetical protein [Paenibacillus massiliensis]|uniref:hypothetical protein n=1 Tax=Paenibacillus massiliensis TaxID=225917 RepID=UPI0003FAFC23|nr:hypothetical protein [Paenibacillus massiliensis]